MLEPENRIKHLIDTIHDFSDHEDKRDILINAVRDLPKTSESISLFQLAFDVINRIGHMDERLTTLLEFVKEIPAAKDFFPLYSKTMESLIEAVNSIKEPINRKTKLLRIADELPKTEEFIKLRLHAMRLALDLSDTPQRKKASLDEIARELPKTSDISFYRSYTLLGIAGELPKTGEFISLYKEAIQRAIDAAAIIKEPYYKWYSLIYIAIELAKKEECLTLYKQAITLAFNAAVEIKDPFAREHALIDILQELPKTAEFFPLIQQIIKEALSFYAAKTRLENIDIIGRLDYFIAGDQRRITESRKIKYTKEKYAVILARKLEQIGFQLNDIRLIETLKPYTHIWIQPAKLRMAARKTVNYLEGVRAKHHGREIERPVFVSEHHPVSHSHYAIEEKAMPKDCIAIDIGATNTVIMKRKGSAQPEFISPASISKVCGEIYVIPTILNPETNSIGAEAKGFSVETNIKKMLLDGNPKGKEYMEKYIRILYQHLRKAAPATGKFSLFSGRLADKLYITAPVGFQNYRKAMKEIIGETIKGASLEFIEEPLAAAIGYQVAEERDKVIMLIDFGGCTLNTMILRLNINEAHVVAKPDRAKTLGGHDIDIWLAEYLAKKTGMPKLIEDNLYGLLISKAEEIKITLSAHRVAPFEWDENEICKVSREDFEDVLSRHDFYKTIDRAISYILKKAEKVGVKKNMIEAILLTGGSSQIPSFKEKIGDLFSNIREQNAIYDHSPLSAVAGGAALYPTKNLIVDRHLGMAYAIRYTTKKEPAPNPSQEEDVRYSYKLILENGESLPVEKVFKITPARTLGIQDEIYLELFEVPENLLARRWVMESGMEFIKQEIMPIKDAALKGLKIITLPFKEPIDRDIYITFKIKDTGHLSVRYGEENTEIETGIRLQ